MGSLDNSFESICCDNATYRLDWEERIDSFDSPIIDEYLSVAVTVDFDID